MITIIGGLLSPYVRKVLAVCALKSLRYQIDPIVPFFGDEQFSALSPLRRIPVLIDDRVTLSDSSVICQYLEERYPAPPIWPEDVAARAHCRWLEEFADTRMGDVFIWKIFNEACIKPAIWRQARDPAVIEQAVADDLPQVMDYLEGVAPVDGFVCGAVSLADISVAVFFRNLRWSRVEPDAKRWPATWAWVERTEQSAPLRRLTVAADALLRVPPAEARDALAGLGFAVTGETVAGRVPRRGPMSV